MEGFVRKVSFGVISNLTVSDINNAKYNIQLLFALWFPQLTYNTHSN